MRRSHQVERLREPLFDHRHAQPRFDHQPAPLERNFPDVATRPPSPERISGHDLSSFAIRRLTEADDMVGRHEMPLQAAQPRLLLGGWLNGKG